MQTTYDHSVTIRDKVIKFRKWKVRDRKKFIKLLDEIKDVSEFHTTQSLVYDCLEDQTIALSAEEFRYLLAQIRKVSIGNLIEFSFACGICESDYTVNLSMDQLAKPVVGAYKEVVVGGVSVTFGDIINKEYYDKAINECTSNEEKYMIDFLYHINGINNNASFTFSELEDMIDDFDIDVLDGILDGWDTIRFVVDDVNVITCTHCKAEEKYSFDDIPGFFPETWFTRK